MNWGNFCKWYLPGLKSSWLLVLFLLFAGGICSMVLQLFVSSNAVNYLGLMIPVIIFIILKGRSNFSRANISGTINECVPLNNPDFGSLGVPLTLALLALATIALAVLLEPVAALIPMPDSMKAIFEAAFDISHPVDMFLSVSVFAPLCEEFLCRGTILRGIAARKGWKKGIIHSAIIFAVIHLNPWQAIPAFVIGLFIGWVYVRTHSLWAAIFIHFTNNTFSYIFSLMFPESEADATLADFIGASNYVNLLVVAAVVLAASLYILNKNLKQYEETLSFEIPSSPQV